jgi:small-conductance mechanosensitive channel/CRP-like cAMP-binding protein
MKTLIRRIFVPGLLVAAIGLARGLVAWKPAALVYLDGAFVFFVALFGIRLLDGLSVLWLTRGRRPFPVPAVLRGFILGVLYLVLVLAVLKSMFQVNISAYLGASAILTMILGLALQPVLSNVLSGISLNATKVFSRGDWVGIGAHEGVVVDTNWRETRVLDRDSNIVVIPNNTVASERIVNFSQPDRRTALKFFLKISPAAPAGDVLGALREAARDCPHVVAEPSPKPYLTGFDESGVSYAIKFWIEDYALKDIVLTEIGRLAWYKLRRQGIEVAVSWTERAREIAGAIEDLASRPSGPDRPDAEIERTAAVLASSTLLRYPEGERKGQLIVPPEAVRELAGLVGRRTYGRGEILFRQGEKGETCYVVASGRIRGTIATEENGKTLKTEFSVGPNGLFGEMSLLTGMPRTATGVVEETAELIEIGADDFAVLLERNADLAGTIADLASRRNSLNLESFRKMKELSARDIERGTSRTSILEHLLNFVRGRR